MNFTELSFESLRKVCGDEARKISVSYDVDLIVYVARAGLPIAVYMNEIFDVDLLGVDAHRQGNKVKTLLAPLLAHFPKFFRNMLISIELKSKVHKQNSERNIVFHKLVEKLEPKLYKTILIVDDSVDTGNSMKLVYNAVKEKFMSAKILTYSLNVWDESKEVFTTDFYSYKNTVIKAPMSKDSKEYSEFLKMYDKKSQMDYI